MDANTQETQETQETTQTLMQMIAAGLAHHQSGRFAEAKNIYMEVLAADPENFDALHLLGVLAHQFGNHELAVDLIEKAVAQVLKGGMRTSDIMATGMARCSTTVMGDSIVRALDKLNAAAAAARTVFRWSRAQPIRPR